MEAHLDDASATSRVVRLIHRPGFVRALAFSPDGKLALTGGDDGGASLWDVSTGQPVGYPMVSSTPVSAVAYGPDGRTVAIATINDVVIHDTLYDRHGPQGRRLKHPVSSARWSTARTAGPC